jgi:WD40 repeat protein
MKYLLLAVFFLAACTNTPATPVAPPTQPPIAWRISGAPIALDNVTQVTTLGRIDQPDTSNTVMTHAVSPDGTRLALLTFNYLFMYDLLTGQMLYRTGRGEPTQLYFSPDKTELYAIAPSGEVTVLDAETGGVLNNFIGHPAYSGAAVFDSLDGRLAMGGRDGTIKVWDAFERVSLATLPGADSTIADLALSPDGARVASASLDRHVRAWEWATRTPLADWEFAVDISRVAFASDNDRIAAGTSAGVTIWSLASGTEVATFPLESGATSILQFSPDGSALVGGNRAAGIYIWALDDTSRLLSRLPDVDGESISARFSPDSRMLITASVGRPVTLWNLTEVTGETIGRADLPVASREIITVDWTEDGRLLFFFDALGSVYVWGIPGA